MKSLMKTVLVGVTCFSFVLAWNSIFADSAYATSPFSAPGANSRSGLGDGTNPGQGAGKANSPNGGTNNPNNSPFAVPPVPPSETHLIFPRTGHRIVRLSNMRVLIVGGLDTSNTPLSSCELYDSTTKLFTTTGSLNVARNNPAVVLLDGGRVLAIGGDQSGATSITSGGGQALGSIALSSSEVYDPSTGVWTLVGNMAWRRRMPEAIKLNDGRVFVSGGVEDTNGFGIHTTEIFDATTGLWTSGPNMLALGPFNTGSGTFFPGMRYGHRMALLPNSKVLIVGGLWHGPELIDFAMKDCEIYDPISNTISPAAPMNHARGRFGLVDIGGKILAIGGLVSQEFNQFFVTTSDIEVYDPVVNNWTVVASLPEPGRYDLAVSSPRPGLALIFGGTFASTFRPTGTVGEFFFNALHVIASNEILLFHEILNSVTLVGGLGQSRSFPFSSSTSLVVDVAGGIGANDFFLCGGIGDPSATTFTTSLRANTILDSAERFGF